MDPLKNTVHLLHGQADNCLTKIDRLFQDSPTEGVGRQLVELLDLNSSNNCSIISSLPPSLPSSVASFLCPFFPSFLFSFLPSLPLSFNLTLASLIELLAEVLDAEQSLFGKRVLTVEEWLKRYLKVGHMTQCHGDGVSHVSHVIVT